MNPAHRPSDTRPRTAPEPRRPGTSDRPGAPDRPARVPDPETLVGQLAIRWIEVRDRQRPLHQLEPFLAPALHHRLRTQLAPLPVPAWHPARLVRVHPDVVRRPDVFQASVVVRQAGRTTALAVRLERHLGQWRVVELTAPEAGLAPLATASLVTASHRRDAFDEVLDPAFPADLDGPAPSSSSVDHRDAVGPGPTASHAPQGAPVRPLRDSA